MYKIVSEIQNTSEFIYQIIKTNCENKIVNIYTIKNVK